MESRLAPWGFPDRHLYLWFRRKPVDARQPSQAETHGEKNRQHFRLQPDDPRSCCRVYFGHQDVPGDVGLLEDKGGRSENVSDTRSL